MQLNDQTSTWSRDVGSTGLWCRSGSFRSLLQDPVSATMQHSAPPISTVFVVETLLVGCLYMPYGGIVPCELALYPSMVRRVSSLYI